MRLNCLAFTGRVGQRARSNRATINPKFRRRSGGVGRTNNGIKVGGREDRSRRGQGGSRTSPGVRRQFGDRVGDPRAPTTAAKRLRRRRRLGVGEGHSTGPRVWTARFGGGGPPTRGPTDGFSEPIDCDSPLDDDDGRRRRRSRAPRSPLIGR